MTNSPEAPEVWRRRAADSRAIAERTNDPGTKRMLLNIAETYEELAARAEARAKR